MVLYDSAGQTLFLSCLYDAVRLPTSYALTSINGHALTVACLPDGTIPQAAADSLLQSTVVSRVKSCIFSDGALCEAIFGWDCNREIEGLAELAQSAGAQTLLDVGCGHGRLLIPLAKCGFSVVGYDAEPLIVAHTNTRVKCLQNAFVLCADMETFSWPEKFDMAFAAMNVLRYLEDPFRMKNHLRRVATSVRAGGTYAVNIATSKGSTRYRQEWPFTFRNTTWRAIWESAFTRYTRHQIIDRVELWQGNDEEPTLCEYQCQIDMSETLLAEIIDDCRDCWSLAEMRDSEFNKVDELTESANIWFILRRV